MGDAANREVEGLQAEAARVRPQPRFKDAPWPPGPKLRDGLVFIGTTALGLAILRAKRADFADHLRDQPVTTSRGPMTIAGWSPLDLAFNGYMWSGLLVSMWTLAVLYFHLRSPRPRLRRVARRPGFAVCAAAALCYALAWLAQIGVTTARGWPPWMDDFAEAVPIASVPVGFAVGSTWFVLALAGRGRPARDWLDRSGCALGVYWIGMIFPSMWDVYLR